MQLTLEQLELTHSNKQIEYKYSTDKAISKFFSDNLFFAKYNTNLKSVPESVLVIPFLANVVPISWFAGFDIKVKSLDQSFYNALKVLKRQFAELHPVINTKSSKLIVEHIVDIRKQGVQQKSAMLFSAGVDSYATYLRHYEEKPDLITIRGADIPLDNNKEWKEVLEYNKHNKLTFQNTNYTVTNNMQSFITFEVDKLLTDLGWWRRVQHGMALTCLVAPLAYLNNYRNIYFASSHDRKENSEVFIRGSMPEIDNNIKFVDGRIVHDGEKLTRQEKVNYIVESAKHPKLRVCYSELKKGLNCSKCEKCVRTIFSLMVAGDNPDRYGFKTNYSIFNLLNKTINKGFNARSNRAFWAEIYDQSHKNNSKFKEDDKDWAEGYASILNKLEVQLQEPITPISSWGRLKQNIIHKFPRSFNSYLKIRRKLS